MDKLVPLQALIDEIKKFVENLDDQSPHLRHIDFSEFGSRESFQFNIDQRAQLYDLISMINKQFRIDKYNQRLNVTSSSSSTKASKSIKNLRI